MEPLATTTDKDAAGSAAGLSREFRAAVIAGDHARAQHLFSGYVEALRVLRGSLPDEEFAASGEPARARELLRWARQAALIQRALAADQLAFVQKARRYQSRSIAPALEVKA